MRKTKNLEELIPWLDFEGISTGDFAEAPRALLGPEAPGRSATTITRLEAVWEGEHEARGQRSLAGEHDVVVRADGVHFNIRLEEGRRCILVLMGATADGKKERIAIADGDRESEQSWRELLVRCTPPRSRHCGPTHPRTGLTPDAAAASDASSRPLRRRLGGCLERPRSGRRPFVPAGAGSDVPDRL